jgi:hypothetical protein
MTMPPDAEGRGRNARLECEPEARPARPVGALLSGTIFDHPIAAQHEPDVSSGPLDFWFIDQLPMAK